MVGEYRVPGTRGKDGPRPAALGIGVLGWSLSPGPGAFPVGLPPGDSVTAMSRSAGLSATRSFRGSGG